jgi:hypothetical protein
MAFAFSGTPVGGQSQSLSARIAQNEEDLRYSAIAAVGYAIRPMQVQASYYAGNRGRRCSESGSTL